MSILFRVIVLGCSGLLLAAAGSTAAEPPAPILVSPCQVTPIDLISVPAREPGVLEKVLVREGRLVEVGELLAQIDVDRPALEREQAEFELLVARKTSENDVNVRFAQAAWEVSKATLARSEDARRRTTRAVSDAELEEQRLAADKAKLQIEQSQRDLEIAEVTTQVKGAQKKLADLNVRRRTIASPLRGVVTSVAKRTGEWVNPGDTVFEVLRVDRVRVEGFLKHQQALPVLVGAAAVVQLEVEDNPVESFPAEIVFVSPKAEPVSGNVRVWAEVDNVGLKLRPGLRVSLKILPGEKPAAKPAAQPAVPPAPQP